MASSGIFDIYDFIIKWAKSQELNKEQRKRIDFKLLGPENVKMDKLDIHYKSANHDNDETLTGPPKPTSHVLFTSTYTNNTQCDQTYGLHTERSTTTTRRIQVMKGLTTGSNLNFKLSAPNSLIAANVTFKDEVRCEKTGESITVEGMKWSLNSEVVVPARSRTRAEFVVEEHEYNGTFKIDIIIDGKLSVVLRDKDTNEIVVVHQAADIREVFRLEDGFERLNPRGVRFVMMGKFQCRFGIEQRVELHQSALMENGSPDKNGESLTAKEL